MFFCNSCHSSFDRPVIITEAHGAPSPYRETTEVCPECESRDFSGLYSGYCRCCGRKIPREREYCNESCRRSGEEMWARQRSRTIERKKDPLYNALKQIDEYNKANTTRLSYGQYIAMREAK